MEKMKGRSSHKWILLIVLLFFCQSANGQAENTYEGLRIPPVPERHREVEAFLIDDKPDSCFALSRMTHKSGEAILLQKLLYHDREGHAHWEVVSALAEPKRHKDYDYFMGTCMLNGEHQREIIALVKSEDQEIQTGILRAWRVSIKNQKIEKIPVDGITCYIEGWGHN
jgi:hypothetical protein